MIKKQWIHAVAVALLAAGLACASVTMPVGAAQGESNEQGLDYGEYSEEDIESFKNGTGVGISNMNFKFDRETRQKTSSLSGLSQSAYPSYYSSVDMGIVTAPKTQGEYACCWAFGAISAVETYAIKYGMKLGGRQADLSLDLSEKHMAYYTYHAYDDVLGNNKGDLIELAYRNQYLMMGGNSIRAAVTLANGEGPVLESTAPYNDAELGASLDYQSLLHLKNMYVLSMRDAYGNPNLEKVKGAVSKYGSAVLTMAYVYGKGEGIDRTLENYYYPKQMTTNHDVTIVGWDDNYAASNFDYRPAGNGAWLVKNSWGAYNAMGGYFWCSYYDPSITAAYVYEMEPVTSYDNNYFYSNIPRISSIGSAYREQKVSIANTFTIKAKGTGYEKITRVGFGLSNYDVKYSLQLYLNSKAGKPTSGKKLLAKAQTGKLANCGYVTIDLKKPVSVKTGSTVTAVITITDPSGDEIYVWTDIGDGGELGGDGHYILYDGKKQSKKSMIKIGSNGWVDLASRSSWDGIMNNSNLSAVMNLYTKTPKTTVKSVTSKSKKAVIKWSKTSGASGYAVYRATKKNGKYTKLAVVSAKKTSYTDKTGKKGKTYYYKVAPIKKINGKNCVGKKSTKQSVKIK